MNEIDRIVNTQPGEEFIALFAAAFEAYGAAPNDVEAWRDVRESTRVAASLAMIVWAKFHTYEGRTEEAARLFAAASELDPDPLRSEIRDAIREDDTKALARIALREDPANLDALAVAWLGWSLGISGSFEEATAWLRRGRDAHPSDSSVQYLLGTFARGHESIAALTAALALRPESVAAR